MNPHFHIELVRQQQLDLQRRLARPHAPSSRSRRRDAVAGVPAGRFAWGALLTRFTPLLPRRHGI